MKINRFGEHIFQAEEILGPNIPLHEHLIVGPEYAVLIDSGLKSSYPAIRQLLHEAGVKPSRLKILFNTHAHHDHIGSNSQLKNLTNCLIAAHPGAVDWIEDHERNFLEFCCAYPELFPDSPALREEIATTMDEPATRVDLRVNEGATFNLGEGVILEALEVAGHMQAELAFIELGSGTLLIGDAITGVDFPFFHGHLNVRAYRQTIQKLQALRSNGIIRQALPAHYPAMDGPAFDATLNRVVGYLNDLDVSFRQILEKAATPLTLEQIWRELCQLWGKQLEWRGLAMAEAHLQDLIASGEVYQLEPDQPQRSRILYGLS